MNRPYESRFKIALLPGDGIGVEVMAEGVRVLRAVEARLDNVRFDCEEYSVGAGEYLMRGDPLPASVLKACAKADAIFLGAMGLPKVRWPDGKEMTPQIDLREKLDLFCGIRPVRLYHRADTPLSCSNGDQIDMVIVRESTEGLFSGRLSQARPDDGEVRDVMRITRKGSERICRSAFELARKRSGRVTLVDKANVLPSMVFFRAIFDEVARQYPAVQADHLYIDTAAMRLVQNPKQFDVLVTENMFGDILSELAAGLIGGIGMAPSADIGEKHALFQPAHGSAPDIAGQGIANPVAAILSAALMLDWLDHTETRRGAELIRQAVQTVLANPANRTPDLGGQLTTAQMGALVIQALPQLDSG